VSLDLAKLNDSLFDDETLLTDTHLIKHLARQTQHVIYVRCKVPLGLHLRQVPEAARIKRLLVRHLGQDSALNALIKLRVSDTPANGSKLRPVRLRLDRHNEFSAAKSVVISDKRGAHTGSEANHTSVLLGISQDRVVVLDRVQRAAVLEGRRHMEVLVTNRCV